MECAIIKKFRIKVLEEKGFVKFYITHPDLKGRVKKHIGKGSSSEYLDYHAEFSNEIEQYFEKKTVTNEVVLDFVKNYVERMKQKHSIFNYTDEFIARKRKTFNSRTNRYLSPSTINKSILAIKKFRIFLHSVKQSELPEIIDKSLLDDYFHWLLPLAFNTRVKQHFHLKEFIAFLYQRKRLPIDESYEDSCFTERYDNQETEEDDKALTISDMMKLNSLRNEFKNGNFNLPPYKISKTIPANLQLKQRATKELNLRKTLDCFLFMCATGLYVSDVSNIKLSIKYSGHTSFINYRRKKNSTFCKGIPLMDVGCFLGATIKKEYGIENNSNFPLNLSLNQFDKNLVIISKLAKLDFTVTSKMARKTFASIYYFDYRIKVEDIQLMLGHKDIKHTYHYLRIQDTDFALRIQEQLKRTG